MHDGELSDVKALAKSVGNPPHGPLKNVHGTDAVVVLEDNAARSWMVYSGGKRATNLEPESTEKSASTPKWIACATPELNIVFSASVTLVSYVSKMTPGKYSKLAVT